ncbi:protein LTO1 homolog [Triticum urartu]|uniref:Essential protein Yae1 N-terminal domain-containing protein n=1 Tax=Triticum urartu TaxID=4572 RepID=A0A8R7U0U7_TRIUA|nr:protein LTO1 homolog [Triticum urartu]XP_048568644.1 protein LTO1 homolog [Triticum urartu]XP_048568645.1 protein LTO1 homolog [Triticum urartu]
MDFLEPMIALNETHYQDGYRDGYDDGLVSGKEEGRQVGLKMGFQVGEELGFYQGCLDVWISIIRLDQDAFSARVRKYMEQLATLLSNYPLSDPENNHLQDMMKEIRLKFRVITGSLGAKLGYEGRPTSSEQDLEDI